MTDDIPWDHYRSFLGVLEHGSLSGAARMLSLTQPTVGRHVDALEARFGQPLFTRSPSGLQPTEAALALRGAAEAMRSHAGALQRAASRAAGEDISGVVRISASEVVAVQVLPPALARLQARHPALTLELVCTNRVQDLLQREADVAVRMLAPAQEALVARHVGEVPIGLYAHRDYLARRGTPATPQELAGHSLIGFDAELPYLRAATQRYPQWRRAAFALRSDSDLAQLALLRAGAGIGVCHAALARRDKALVRVLGEHFAPALPVWITMHEDLRASARCKAVFDALVRCLLDYTDVAQAVIFPTNPSDP